MKIFEIDYQNEDRSGMIVLSDIYLMLVVLYGYDL